MIRLLQYFNWCIIFNIFMSCWFLVINYSDNVSKNVFNALEFIAFLNIAKIIIQFEITRKIRKRLLYTKELNIDIILDFAKIGYYTYMFILFDKFFNNIKMYIVATIIGINYFIIFLQMIYNLLSLQPLSTSRAPLIYTSQPEVHIAFSDHLNVYSVSNNTNIICPICLDEQLKSENWTKLRCEHEFHNKCISEWFNKNRSCPTCRIDI